MKLALSIAIICLSFTTTYGQAIEGSSANIIGGDAVYSSQAGDKKYQLIGTYQGWNDTGIYIGGYNFTNSGNHRTKKIFFGGGFDGQGFMFDIPSQRLGLGTSFPQSKFHIVGSGTSKDIGGGGFNGDFIIQANTGGRNATSGAQLEFVIPANIDGSNSWGQGRIITVAGNGNDGDATGKMILGTRRNFNKTGAGNSWYYGDDLTIGNSGNVGIRTTNPSNIFDVNFANNEPKNLTVFSSLDNNVGFGPMGGLRFGWYNTNLAEIQLLRGNGSDDGAGLSFHTSTSNNSSTSERMRILQNGNIGIGLTTPSAKLHIKGSSAENANVIIESNKWNSVGDYSQLTFTENNHYIRGEFGVGMTFNDVNKFMFTGGNVGIGTTAPSEKLSVNGNIRSKEIKVETSNWPDYVFRKNYELMPLTQVKSFIEENSHLPDIPSASEMEKHGISLGEMNKILTKKVEELTLHLIEKNEEILRQQAQLKIHQIRLDKIESKLSKVLKDPRETKH